MKLLIPILFLLIYSNANAGEVDEWKSKFYNPTASTKEKAIYAESLMVYYKKINPDSALAYCRQLKKFAVLIKDTGAIDYSNVNFGSLYRYTGNLDSAIYYYNLALASYKKQNFEDGVASIYNNFATVYKTQSRYDLAIKNYLEALAIFKNTTRYNARGNLYSNFAGLYFILENYKKAQELWHLAELDFSKVNSFEISHPWRGFARIQIIEKNYKKATEFLEKAIQSDIDNKIVVYEPVNYVIQMEIAELEGNHQLFLETQKKTAQLLHHIDIPLIKSKFYELNADYYYSKFDNKLALQNYDSALFYLNASENPEQLLQVLKKKFKLEISDPNSRKSLLIPFNIILNYEKIVADVRKDRITQETDARYSLSDKEERISILDEKNKVANELIETERKLKQQSQQQILWMWIGIGLFVILVIYILFIIRKLQSSQRELQKNIQQKEFLFKELNHRVKNNLHIVGSFLSIESFGKTDEVKEILLTCENRIQSLGLVHEMLYRGEIGEEIQLQPYLEKLVDVISKTLIQDDTIIQSNIPSSVYLKSDKAVLLGLIANELITNAIKYAKISNQQLIINLFLKKENNNFELIIRDNGKGFDENSINKNSMGLKLAKGLSGQLNGKLEITNNNGAEFTLQFSN